jgi:hypothetical protein
MNFTRRHSLSVACSILISGLAGCQGNTSKPDKKLPTNVVRRFYTEANASNFEAANALVHPNSTEGEILNAEQTVFERQEISVVSTTLRSQNENKATVIAQLRITREDTTEMENTTIILRKHNQSWRLYRTL